ncbi:hypothetical protein D9M72_309040 [compost metagenome]
MAADIADRGGAFIGQQQLQDVLGIDIALHVVEVVPAHRVLRVRLVDQLAAHAVGGFVETQVDHVVARRHDRGNALELEFEHILDQVEFMLVQHAGFGAGIDHRGDVLGGDLVDRLGRQAQQPQRGIGGGVEDPHQRLEHAQQRQHRVDHRHRAPLGEGHGDTLGDQVSKLDKQQRHDQERADIGRALGVDHLHIGR